MNEHNSEKLSLDSEAPEQRQEQIKALGQLLIDRNAETYEALADE
jgi:hypothetical protein